MMSTTGEYCVVCGHGPLNHEQQSSEFDVRGETIRLDLPVTVCPACGTSEVEDDLDPAAMAFAEYRKRRGLLTPEQVREIRERYSLSQKSFAALLGMSEATINRYEGGGLQDDTHDQVIRACGDPDVMRDCLERRGNRLSPWRRKRAEAALSNEPKPRGTVTLSGQLWRMPRELSLVTGFRKFTYEKYAAVVVWLCRRLERITPTSLNKLLFYADFLHYRSESVSLMGAAYRRLPYGPVPADFGGLREQMELDQYVEIREVEYQNGNIGEEYRLGPRADAIGVSLTAREERILAAVADAFKNATPCDISERSHQESAWRDTPDKALISYEKAADLSLAVPE